jgi:hypothetical protein
MLTSDVGGAVRRAVVDDEYVDVRQLLLQLVEDGRKIVLLIPGRDEDKRLARRFRW